VVLCTHAMDTYPHFRAAADSVLGQTHEDVELVVVVDGTPAVFERVREAYGDRDDVVLHCNEANVGLLESRNTGADLASGDVVAFIDDDAVADEAWVAALVDAYEETGYDAVGGRMAPLWIAGKPASLPEEFYWLVGVTHGSNISFDRGVFLELGGFDADIGGRKGDRNLQGGETELCARLRAETGRGVWYTPAAVVSHKVFDYRTDPRWLLDRAFWQGYSKRAMEVLLPESSGEETAFLGALLTDYVPQRLVGLPFEGRDGVKQLCFLFLLTAAVGLGYLAAFRTWR